MLCIFRGRKIKTLVVRNQRIVLSSTARVVIDHAAAQIVKVMLLPIPKIELGHDAVCSVCHFWQKMMVDVFWIVIEQRRGRHVVHLVASYLRPDLSCTGWERGEEAVFDFEQNHRTYHGCKAVIALPSMDVLCNSRCKVHR